MIWVFEKPLKTPKTYICQPWKKLVYMLRYDLLQNFRCNVKSLNHNFFNRITKKQLAQHVWSDCVTVEN